MENKLESSVTVLFGVSSARQKLLSKLGIVTLRDLLWHFPREHENRQNVVDIADASPGEYSSLVLEVVTNVVSTRIHSSMHGKTMTVQKFIASDKSGGARITFFNCDFLKDVFKVGRKFRFYGRVDGIAGACSMTSPEYEPFAEGKELDPFVPKYPLTAGLSSKLMSSLIKQALDICKDSITERFDKSIRQEYGLCTLYEALWDLHFPKDEISLQNAKKRLAFDELYDFQLKITLLGENGRTGKAHRIKYPDMKAFVNALDFELTTAQKRAIQDILVDISESTSPDGEKDKTDTLIVPARRLVQGDVGSGKTIVAAASLYACAKSGFQSALMVPTGVLAVQHYKSLSDLFSKFRITCALLTGETKAAQKKDILQNLKNGKIQVLIGTHALIEDNVEFKNLALVITDEQHRFGVNQRKSLESKGFIKPHTIVMSATPIPRTLALIMYCDLDISVIDVLPKGRQRIDTFAIGEDKRKRAYDFVRNLVKEGRQGYIVCPLAEEKNSDGEYIQTGNYEMKSAKKICEELSKGPFYDLRVEYIHGRMKQAQKDEIMSRFSQGLIDVLVSTTVIEVGVNVPNAAVMLVENAERFGLSQLHQLRGRVGRGVHKSYCILVSPLMDKNKESDFAKRIKIMCESSDGFQIARKDLEIRGPGEFFGRRQHGQLIFKMADMINDVKILEATRKLALMNVKKQKELEIGQIGI